MSSGSKPATTTGLPYCFAMNSYGRQPITVDTCPGPMKPSSRRSGESRMALMAGTIVTWLQNTEKFSMPSAAARIMVIAVDGAVVSNPIAMNTTCLSGFCRAIFSESSGEYTIRMFVPSAFASKNEPPLPGTRIMSPNEVMITSGCEARWIASSTRPIGITQTGQPGPCTRVIDSGR